MPGIFGPLHDALGPTLFFYALSPAIKILVLMFLGLLPLISYLVLAERKILGFIQVRTGPNRVGPWGLFQPIADLRPMNFVERLLAKKFPLEHEGEVPDPALYADIIVVADDRRIDHHDITSRSGFQIADQVLSEA